MRDSEINVFSLALALAFVPCCGPAVTHATRTAYAIEQARCVASEEAIVARTGTTEAEDLADLATERARCDAALRTIGGN